VGPPQTFVPSADDSGHVGTCYLWLQRKQMSTDSWRSSSLTSALCELSPPCTLPHDRGNNAFVCIVLVRIALQLDGALT
jgi:hypothetical protein